MLSVIVVIVRIKLGLTGVTLLSISALIAFAACFEG